MTQPGAAANVPVAALADNPVDQNVVINAGQNGQLNLKIEQNKLPTFFGMKHKDTITAAHMIARVNALKVANEWNEQQTYMNFALALQGAAQEWIRTISDYQQGHTQTWAFIEPEFRKTFATTEDDSALMDQLTALSMKSSEDPVSYFNRVHRVMELMYMNFPEQAALPVPAAGAGHRTDEETLEILKARDKNVYRYMSLQVFRAGLPKNLRSVVQQQKPQTIVDAFHIVREQHQIQNSLRSSGSIMVCNEDNEITEVAAIPPMRPMRPQQPQQQYQQRNNFKNNGYNKGNNRQQQQQPRNNFKGPGNNSANNGSGAYCVYCKKPNHDQDVCRKRIADNQPCRTARGAAYWPKNVNAVDQADNDSTINSLGFHF